MTLMLTLADISADTWSRSITDVPQVAGRSPNAEIHLESRFVSKEHCRFWYEAGEYFVEDCGSTNGTFLGGRRIQREALKSGDHVLIGNFEILVADNSHVCPTDYELPSSTTLMSNATVEQLRPAQTAFVPLKPLETDRSSKPVEQIEHIASSEERRLAAAVHQRLTPNRRIGLPGMLVEVAYLPSGNLGGDCFECLELSDRYVLAMFDSMNHGTNAALTIMLIRAELRRWVSLTHEPGKCLEQLNAELLKLQINDLYIAASLAMWFPMTSTVVYATAGHHPPFWIREGELLNPRESAGGLPLGISAGETFEERLLQLRPKDRLFFFSDGLSDSVRERTGPEASSKRLADELLKIKTDGLHQLSNRLIQSTTGMPRDDALIVACEIGPTPGSRQLD